ncbi:MAG: FkbM family methyltransferase [Spirulinaceae cyanobacterium]
MAKERRLVRLLVWSLQKQPAVGKLLLKTLVQFDDIFHLEPHPKIISLTNDLGYRLPIICKLYNGMKIEVLWNETTVGQRIYKNGCFEKDTVELVSKLLQPGMVFVDGGAHCGQYTLVASKCVGESGEVHSFEPDPDTFAMLSDSIKLNGLKNVYLNQLALSDRIEVKELYLAMANNIGGNSLYEPENYSGDICTVKCTTLDSYLKQHKISKIDLLKLDIEGYEMNVLESSQVFKDGDSQPFIVVEFNESNQQKIGKSCQEMANFLRKCGYKLCLIGKRHSGGIDYSRVGLDALFNVLAVPDNKITFVEKNLAVQFSDLPLDNTDGLALKVLKLA